MGTSFTSKSISNSVAFDEDVERAARIK